MIGLAQLGGPIAALALALLLLAPRRKERLAALGFAAFGALVLGAALAPHQPARLLRRRCSWRSRWRSARGASSAPTHGCCRCSRSRASRSGSASTSAARISKLLVPLYVVIGGGVVLLVWDLSQATIARGSSHVAPGRSRCSSPGRACRSLWSKDVHYGAVELLAFYLPFTLLAICDRAVAVERARRCACCTPWSTVMGVAFAVVGFYQYETRNIFQNPKLINANSYAPFFRVNSVFWDPSVYGRFLVIAMLPSLVLLVTQRLGRIAFVACAALVVMWAGLLISFSQSSFAALLVVVAGAAFVFWRWRALDRDRRRGGRPRGDRGRAAAGPASACSTTRCTGLNRRRAGARASSPTGSGSRARTPCGVSASAASSTRTRIACTFKGKEPKKAASHNTPVTVAAETGLPGLALFAWLLVAAFRQAFRRRPRSLCARRGLGLAAIFCHSLFYNDFFEDPMTWGSSASPRSRAPRSRRVQPVAGLPSSAKEAVPVVIEHWQRALVLAPHTDDGEFGCGGTMARLVDAGCEVRYVAFSIATRSLPEGFPPDTLAREVREATTRARHPGGAPRPCTTSTCARSPSTGRTSSSCSSRRGRSSSRTSSSSRRSTTSTRITRRSPRKGCARSSARRSSATRSRGTTSTSRTSGTSRSRRRTSSGRSRRSSTTRHSSTAATRTPSTSGTSRARTGST